MQVKNLEVVTFGSHAAPDGINADVELDSDVTLVVYRDWNDPQWYLYDVEFGDGPGRGTSILVAGIDGGNSEYPIPCETDIFTALERAVDALRSEYSPA